MTNAVAIQTPNAGLVPAGLDQAERLAHLMARGKLVPSHLQSSPGDCLMVIEQAMRWGMSPFAVAQSTSVVKGKLMFEGKLVAAALQASGILATRLDFNFSGSGRERVVTVSAIMRGETNPRSVEVKLSDVATSNDMWTKQPDQQLVYSGTRIWGRRHAPEVMLGVYAPEEFESRTIDAEATQSPPSQARQERQTDYVRLIGSQLLKKKTPQEVVQKRAQWVKHCADADAAGSPISNDVQEQVFQIIQDRENQLREEQSAAPVEEAEAELMPS